MRLLNTKTVKVEEFITDIPTYAILSHTWEKDEVTFQDIRDYKNLQDVQGCPTFERAKKKAGWKKTGWSKIWHACKYVRQYKFEWIWIATCCIDKSSSAELSEALNSMYNYYGDGRVCITYLSDISMERGVMDIKKLEESRWFTRGWTLQELIAPRYMVFVDEEWNMIGTRFSMRKVISEVTCIPVKVFERGELDGYSIAQKMSWAASRKTTREEDMAYCLMGLFGVNMPPIYGEGGAKAFTRLQQEIIKYSDDRSIFAWVATIDYHRDRGLFASSPSEFASSGEVGISDSENLGDKSAFSFGNSGLSIHLSLHHPPGVGKDIYVASLHCPAADSFVGIYLQKQGQRYIQWNPHFQLPRIDKYVANLKEVVVKEGTVARQQIRKSGHSFSFEFKFDPQITLSNEIDRYSDDVATYSVPECGAPYSIHSFTLRTKKGKEFSVKIWTVLDEIIPVIGVHIHNRSISSYNRILLQDSVLWPVKDDDEALLSYFTHMTGGCLSQRVVEFSYIPSSNARFQLYRQIDGFGTSPRAPSLTSLDFIVDINSSSN